MKTFHRFFCGTSTSEEMEIAALNEEEAAIGYAMAKLASHPGAFASVWVGEIATAKTIVRTCYTIMVPGACPFETEQFRALVRWYMAATGCSGELAWNKCVWLLARADLTYEETPGCVPITLDDRETECGHTMTFNWNLAGAR